MSDTNIEPLVYIVRFSNITPQESPTFYQALTDVVGPGVTTLLEPGDEVVVTSSWPENALRSAVGDRIAFLKALAAANTARSG